MKHINGIARGYWIATSLFALQKGFTADAQLRLPKVAVGDDASKWGWAVGTTVLWGLSYVFFRQRSPGASRLRLSSSKVRTA